jgi:hypothetical protein
MGTTTVNSPNNSTRDQNDPMRGYSPGAYSSPSNSRQRADGGHIAGHVGKSASGPASISRDNIPPRSTPVQGGQRGPTTAEE